jgi:hypothetical protein
MWRKWRASGAVKPVLKPFILKPHRVIFPLFEIASNPTSPLTQIKERRFELIARRQAILAPIQAEENLNQLTRRVLEGILKVLEKDPCQML